MATRQSYNARSRSHRGGATRRRATTRSRSDAGPRGGRTGGRRTTRTATRQPRARSSARRPAEPAAILPTQVEELCLQALETEQGGVLVYETAIACATNAKLREEWQEYLEQTRRHVDVVKGVCQERGIVLDKQTPGRMVVRRLGESLVEAMKQAQASGNEATAQLVAAECVVLAETKDHANWELFSELAKSLEGDAARVFKDAVGEVEDEEDEHLYHTKGWARELWIESLGLPAVLPPPEETRDVRSMAGAAMAKKGRRLMAKPNR